MLPTIYKPPLDIFGDEALQTWKLVKLKRLPTIYKPPPGTFGDEALQTGKHVKSKMLTTIHEPHWTYFAMELHKPENL